VTITTDQRRPDQPGAALVLNRREYVAVNHGLADDRSATSGRAVPIRAES
jgi:hypothetical protein